MSSITVGCSVIKLLDRASPIHDSRATPGDLSLWVLDDWRSLELRSTTALFTSIVLDDSERGEARGKEALRNPQ